MRRREVESIQTGMWKEKKETWFDNPQNQLMKAKRNKKEIM